MFKKTKILILTLILCLSFIAPTFAENENIPAKVQDMKEIYEKLEPADFNYIFDMDPYQLEEYQKYMYTPYPLFRTSVEFKFKNVTIPPGYYLLTPREKDGKWYVLFKTNGRVKYIIPVYEKDLVAPAFYARYVPEAKLNWWDNLRKKTRNTVGRIFKKSTQRTPAPKSYIDVNEIGNEFWQVVLYYGSTKYYLIFMR